jgi:hypothetical protein
MFRAWKQHVPAFKDAYFIESYPWIGVRESRRILGQHVLSEDDLMKGRRFDDAIATGCWYLDLHRTRRPPAALATSTRARCSRSRMTSPTRSLLPQKLSNLLVAGRCHSATRGAHASTRVTVTAMAMGEAAGMAAALGVATKTEPGVINGQKVREALAKIGGGPFTE